MKSLMTAILVFILSTMHGAVGNTYSDTSDLDLITNYDFVVVLNADHEPDYGLKQPKANCLHGCGDTAHFATSCPMIHRASIILGMPSASAPDEVEWYVKPVGLSSKECVELLRPPIT